MTPDKRLSSMTRPRECSFSQSDWSILARHWFPVAVATELLDAPVPLRLLDSGGAKACHEAGGVSVTVPPSLSPVFFLPSGRSIYLAGIGRFDGPWRSDNNRLWFIASSAFWPARPRNCQTGAK